MDSLHKAKMLPGLAGTTGRTSSQTPLGKSENFTFGGRQRATKQSARTTQTLATETGKPDIKQEGKRSRKKIPQPSPSYHQILRKHGTPRHRQQEDQVPSIRRFRQERNHDVGVFVTDNTASELDDKNLKEDQKEELNVQHHRVKRDDFP